MSVIQGKFLVVPLGVLLFAITLFITLLPLAASGSEMIVLTDGEPALTLSTRKTEVFEDRSAKLVLDQILSPSSSYKFKQLNGETLSFQATMSAWWIRFTLRNESEKKWYLLIDSMLGGDFDLYVFPVEDDSIAPKLLTKNQIKPLKDYRRLAWSLDLPRNQTYQVYMRATNGDSKLELPVEILTADIMLEKSNWSYLVFGAAYFAMIVLAIYQFVNAFILRDISYATLGVFMVAMMAAFHRSSPAFSSLGFLDGTTGYFSTAPISIMLASFMVFSRQMLETREKAPLLDWAFKAVIAVAFLMVFTIGSIELGKKYPVMLGLVVLLLVLGTSIYLGRKGNKDARNFAWVFLIPVLAQVPNIIVMVFHIDMGIGKTTWDLVVVGSTLIFMFFMTIIQAERVRKMRENMQKNEAKALITNKLSKYVGPDVYREIYDGKIDTKLEAHSKDLTIFFSDIVGFTDKSEKMEITELAIWLNNYLNEMAQIALSRDGTIDKFIGDAVMVFYGDPKTQGKKQDAINCVRMAIAMQGKAQSLGIKIRIGISSGKTTVGNFGANDRMDYTVVGRSVNLAARLEHEAEPGQILISGETYKLVHMVVPCESYKSVNVKGFELPIQTYQVVQNP